MPLCMYVCICDVCRYIYICLSVCVYVICVGTYICLSVCMCMYVMCVGTYIYMPLCMYVCECDVCRYTYMIFWLLHYFHSILLCWWNLLLYADSFECAYEVSVHHHLHCLALFYATCSRTHLEEGRSDHFCQ